MIIGSGSDTDTGVRAAGRPTAGTGANRGGDPASAPAAPAAPSRPSRQARQARQARPARPSRQSEEALFPDLDRTALEDQRDFLLASLRDLDAEHDAGDIGDLDYERLRDDYTARAAGILRALEAETTGRASGRTPDSAPEGQSEATRPSRRRRRTAAIAAGIAIVAVGAAWAVTASSGSRLANQPITGTFAGSGAPNGNASSGIASSGKASGGGAATVPALDPRLAKAAQLVQQGKVTDALKLYDQVLKDRPNDPEALASEGWLIAQAGMAANRTDLVDQGLAKIETAERADSSYPTAHFFRGALLFQARGDAPGAITELREYLGLVSPSAPEVPQVEQMLQAAIKAAGANVPPGPNAPPSSTP